MKKQLIPSRTQIITYMMIFIIPLSLFAIIYVYSTLHIVIEKNYENNFNTLLIEQAKLENTLKTIEVSMANIVASDANFIRLSYPTSWINAHLYSYDILQSYKQLLSSNAISGGMFVYSDKNSIYREVYKNVPADIYDKNDMTLYLKNLLYKQNKSKRDGWFISYINNRYYLMRILGMRDTYSICAIDLGEYSPDMINGKIMYAAREGEPITNIEFVDRNNIEITNKEKYYISGDKPQYFIVQSYSEYIKLNIIYMTEYEGVLAVIQPMQTLLLASLFILFLMIWLSLHLTQRHFLSPLSQMVKTMERIQKGDLHIKMVTSFRNEELVKLSKTFNATIAQINKLKIDAYERAIETRDVQMQYLQIQIRPHFYMNCLSSLFGMAQIGKTKQLQGTILTLSNYLRGIFECSATMISIEDEIVNVEKYLIFRQWNDSFFSVCNINIDPAVKSINIPTLSILSFVENAFKHAKKEIKQLRINIRANKILTENDKYINITIMDNGQGFSEEMLEILNDENKVLVMKNNVGIANVVKRLSLAYEKESSVVFSNSNGACVDIFIPIRRNQYLRNNLID